jgi:hypothetical protein
LNHTDNSIIQLFISIIREGLDADGYTNVKIQQANQPTQQGVPSAPTVFFYKVSMKRYGFMGRFDTYNAVDDDFTHKEKQYYESTFSIQTLVKQNPGLLSYTASDLADEVASILQSSKALDQFKAQGVGILRITNIINPYFTDDKDNFESIPTFDFTLLYSNERLSTVPIVDSLYFDIYHV